MIPQARGQDLMTFGAIEPLLMVALLAYRKRAIAAVLAWMGALSYLSAARRPRTSVPPG